jgi:putative inorganic carbon (hco3(-)) transporter
MSPAITTPFARKPSIEACVALIGIYLMLSPVWMPWFLAPEIYDRARVFQLALLCSLALLALVPAMPAAALDSWFALGRSVRILLGTFLAGGMLSAAASAAPQVGAQQVGLMALLVWLFLVANAAARSARQQADPILTLGIAIGAGLFVLNFWVTYLLFLFEGRSFPWASPFFAFANVRFFAQYQSYVLLLVTLPLLVFRPRIVPRALLYFVAVSLWSFQWVLNSRALWAGLALAALLTCLFATRKRLRWLMEQALLVLAGGLTSLLFLAPAANQIPTAFSIVERGSYSVNERLVIAKSAAELIAESPILGVGPGQFGLNYSETLAAHPHNTVIQLLTEYGVIAGGAGIALLVILFFYGVVKLRKETTRQPEDLVPAVLLAALVMGLGDSLFSGNLTMPHSQVLCFLLTGWIVGRTGSAVVLPAPAAVAVTRTAIAGVAILAGLVTAVLAFEYLDVVRDARHALAARIPSFWQYGRFDAW